MIPEAENSVSPHFRSAMIQRDFRVQREWAVRIAADHDKKQIVLGLEPTGHYGFCPWPHG